MNDLITMFDKIGRDMAKQRIDANPHANYFQKATVKAYIDGECNYSTYVNRVNKYFFEYVVKEYQNRTR